MKKVLLVVKNIHRNGNLEKDKSSLNKKRGSELTQTVLITAVMVTIIAALFFPQLKSLFSGAMSEITTWFNSVLGDITKV